MHRGSARVNCQGLSNAHLLPYRVRTTLHRPCNFYFEIRLQTDTTHHCKNLRHFLHGVVMTHRNTNTVWQF